MTAINIVLKSVNDLGETRCVDVFRRPDGTFGFEEFRRDVEDGQGWFPVGFFGDRVFTSAAEALREARLKVTWLNNALRDGS